MTTAEERRRIGARLRTERKRRRWLKPEMARQLADHITDQCPDLETLISYVKRWEAGKVGISERYQLAYSAAFGMDHEELFGDNSSSGEPSEADADAITYRSDDQTKRRRFILDFLAGLGLAASARSLLHPGQAPLIGDEHLGLVRSALEQLEHTDAQRGGDLICEGAAALLTQVDAWIQHGTYPSRLEGELYQVAGHLGAWAGWTAYDAERHDMAWQHYLQTLLLARTREDLPLEARVLSYMSLQSQRQGRSREAVQLAERGLRTSAGWATPRMTALLHLRCAQGYAGMQDRTSAQRHLTLAKRDFDRGPHEDDLSFLEALTSAEVAGVEGMAYVTLGEHRRAATLFQTIREDPHPAFPRNTTYYTVRLADALRRAGNPVDAFEVAAEAVPLVSAVNSTRIRRQLASLRRISRTVHCASAKKFDERYDEAFEG